MSRCNHPAQLCVPHLLQSFRARRGGQAGRDKKGSFCVLEQLLGVATNKLDKITIKTLGKLNQESSSSHIEF